ncbi:MAG: methylase involved in ubiquinone/menaquinone biosynthesis [Herbinix sp.]|jgi:2-polyprenyl-3-methyl-5-hydroxy-6-metoxy-1,4-benzoquinol methylase|nr:methylase involved in ubiquinone/menaquinone biosynthesis [Herbinix sp.]
MEPYQIMYQSLPISSLTARFQTDLSLDSKKAFWDSNPSLGVCAAMILRRPYEELARRNVHHLLYGNYLGGFLFEGYHLLPPLCILNVIAEDLHYNAVYYNGTIYDPLYGVYSEKQYGDENREVKSYIQIFLEEAYTMLSWMPNIPYELQERLQEEESLLHTWEHLSGLHQSKILNFIHPFSKASSMKECRSISQPLKPKQIDRILAHIRSLYPALDKTQSVWEELEEFETKEAVSILHRCGLTSGMTVLDMGCGHGHYTIPAAIAVGKQGQVIAVDGNKKVLNEAKVRINELNLNHITYHNTTEAGLEEYRNQIDFIILYDVLHGGEWKDQTKEKVGILHSLLKASGILSLALYSEIEHKVPEKATPTKKGFYSTVPIPHEEAIKPYIKLLEGCGVRLQSIVENGGVHFDHFHSPYHWKKYGEVRVNTLERRNIYNFVKIS